MHWEEVLLYALTTEKRMKTRFYVCAALVTVVPVPGAC
jgi:hypothetical protein